MTLEEARQIAPEYNPNGGMIKARYETGENMLRYLDAVMVIDEAAGINTEDVVEDDEPPKSWWNYRVLEEVKDGISTFSIIEVHYNEGKFSFYSDSDLNTLAGWNTYNELKGTWELVKHAFDKPVVKKDENGSLYEDGKENR